MTDKEILDIVLREMTFYGQAYRMSWAEFDGRTLRSQLNSIEAWAKDPDRDPNFCEGSDFYNDMLEDLGFEREDGKPNREERIRLEIEAYEKEISTNS